MWSFEGEEEGWCERDGGRIWGDVILLYDLIYEIGCGYKLNYLEMLVMNLLLSDVMLGGRWIQKKGCIRGPGSNIRKGCAMERHACVSKPKRQGVGLYVILAS